MHLWEQVDNERLYSTIEWVPYVYLPTNRSEIHNIYGKPVTKKTFPDYFSYTKFLEDKAGNPNLFENKVRMEIQFLGERYHGIPDEELPVPNLRSYYLDIEVMGTEGFPDPKDAADPIILISIRDSYTDRTVTFGYDVIEGREYQGENARYIPCNTEEQLLTRFFAYVRKFPCDVISGWNIWSFDLPYIFNRAKNLFGEEEGIRLYRKISPINVVNVWKQKKSDDVNIDMGGITILDYYNLYRWYGKKLERYTLDYVSQKELKEGKLDWKSKGYKDINEFAEKDWNTFVDYNVIDCQRVHDLENQLGYIRMVQALGLLCKAPMKYYNSMTQLIEGAMITHYRRKNLCAPYFAGGSQKTFTAAHVKDPIVGLHNWIVDVDITSSYPSHIIALNMSNETFMGIITGMSEREVIYHTRNRSFPRIKLIKLVDNTWKTVNIENDKLDKFNHALQRGLLAIAPCGSIFSTTKTGVIAEVEKAIFFKRKEVKELRNRYGNQANECEGLDQKKCKDRERELDSLQLALKIMMNAFFGILSVPYSRYFNTYIAEAITSCGRRTIKAGQSFCNELLNDPSKDENLSSVLHEMKVNATQYKEMKI